MVVGVALLLCCPVLQALSKNGEYLGDRYVRLLHVPKQEMEEQVWHMHCK